MTVLTIPQGATRTIRITDIVDSEGEGLNVSGWAVRAVARGSGSSAPLVAEWSTTPTGSQGQATASGRVVTLSIPAAMSAGWTWRSAELHVKITEPGVNGRVERFPPIGLLVDPEV